MYFIGVDLAWKIEDSTKCERCAVTVLDKDCNLLGNSIMKSDHEIAEYILRWQNKDGFIIGIDAPLTIPEWVDKQRKCELILGKIDMPAFPSNRKRFIEDFNGIRGERLVSLLESKVPGLSYEDSVEHSMQERVIMEIYPYAALKVLHWEAATNGNNLTEKEFKRLFNQIKVPKYKGSGLNKADRIDGLSRNISLLKKLINTTKDFSTELVKENFNLFGSLFLANMKIAELEQVADYLDSVVAAYTIWRYWKYGSEKSMVIGNKKDGYILIPADENVKLRCAGLCDLAQR